MARLGPMLAGLLVVVLPACVALRVDKEMTSAPRVKAGPSSPAAGELAGEFPGYPQRPGEVVRRLPMSEAESEPLPPMMPPAVAVPVSPPVARPVGERAPPLTFPHWELPPPTTSEPPLLRALQAYLDNKPELALQAIAGLDPHNQDFVLAIVPLLARGSQLCFAREPEATAELVSQLQALAARLEPHAALRLGTVAFCHPVHGYRRYEPRSTQLPYRPRDLAQLYIEVHNIGGQPARGPRGEPWLIQARATVIIRDAYGEPVAMPDPLDPSRRRPQMHFEEKRYTRGPVRDFYLLCAFPVPEQPGVYTATVEVSDPHGRRSAPSAPLEFRVASQ